MNVSEFLLATRPLTPINQNDKILAMSLSTQAKNVDVQDVVDDLAELRFLIEDLDQFASDDPNSDKSASYQLSEAWFHANFRKTIDALRAKHQRNLDLVERATRWATCEDRAQLLDSIRKEFLSLKSALRIAYRQKGSMLCARDWQSPIYAASIPLGINRLTDGIAEHKWDYKRDGHLDALEYENRFLDQYASHLGSPKLEAYLANSGMAGFSSVIHWLADELHLGSSCMAVMPMYFENIHLARAFFPHLVQVTPESPTALLKSLREQKPSVVFVDAVSNCNEVIEHDVNTILDWAKSETAQQVAIVIDTTCLPTMFLRTNLLRDMPSHVSVIFVESLAKYHQFGMDVVTGGVVMIHAEEEMQSVFKKTRARLGTNIADSTVGSLPTPDRQMLMRRMRRHARNTRLLINNVEEFLTATDGVLESVSWLRRGPTVAPWFTSSCFTLHLLPAFRTIKHYREFEQRVVELAEKQRLPIALGTSFGFDVSRLYVTAPSTRFEDPFLRVSIGTETAAQIESLVEIIRTVNTELREIWGAPPPGDDSEDAGASDTAKKESRPRSLSSANVFVGEQALKDYLCPANYQATPLVELPEDLNPFRKDNVRIFAKIMPLVPLMNIKSIPAYSMLAKAAERGDLEGVEHVIESSSSNTVLSLSVIAKLFGIDHTCALVDDSIAPGLVRMLRLFGIDVMMHPGPGHKLYGRVAPRSERAAKQGAVEGWMNPGQYGNPDNPEGFAQWLAPDLWNQTDGRLGLLSCALGTCGTMVGVSRGLRNLNPNLEVIACCPAAGQAVPGPRERSQLHDVKFDWQEVAQQCFELPAKESFDASVKLLRRGILGGPSSGMNYAGLLRHLQNAKATGRLQSMVQPNGELWCAFLCCDSPLPHVDEYYEALGDDYFPAVQPVEEAEKPTLISLDNAPQKSDEKLGDKFRETASERSGEPSRDRSGDKSVERAIESIERTISLVQSHAN